MGEISACHPNPVLVSEMRRDETEGLVGWVCTWVRKQCKNARCDEHAG